MRIALGVTGCIGAYKAALILRHLQEAGAEVEVVMTRRATEFIQPLTFQALSGRRVITDENENNDSEILHIALAQRIDLLLVAPCTANTMAKFAHGIADDFLSTLYISTPAPVLLAPAMNVVMWEHPATQANIALLRKRGVHFVEPDAGYLACGMEGRGRLADPQEIAQRALSLFHPQDLVGERVLITAGPTREYIDPVRFITNRSSGKMGYALAEAARKRGAEVTLVSGPVQLSPPQGVQLAQVTTTEQMYNAVLSHLERATIVVKAAAVCDYRPSALSEQKLKKKDLLTLELEATPDILAAVGAQKGARLVVGFAAETERVVEHARSKLERKNLDLIVANDVSAPDAGFDVDTNRVILISRNAVQELPLMSKHQVAHKILDAIIQAKTEQSEHDSST